MKLRKVRLDDKYLLAEGQVYLTGTQALVRLPLMQYQRDRKAGLKTAGFISGYRGSPLGGFDQTLWQAQKHLDENQIVFTPGINEDLGATAVWGSQQTPLFKGATVGGVFSMWYGKGPGVDRTGDVFKHANAAGSSALGGVLALAGDDHACKSSTLPHQSEYAFEDASIPVLVPSNVQEILDLGLYGWALSRYSGCWVGFKVTADTIDTSASVSVSPERVHIVYPKDFALPEGGLNIRWPDAPLEQEKRLRLYKLKAAQAFVRVNKLDRIIIDASKKRLGLVTCGKSYHDVSEVLDELGLTPEKAADLGIGHFKVAMPWPLEPTRIREFAQGYDEILVVEEKRPLIENQLKDILYHLPEKERPRVVGKVDEVGSPLLPETSELHVPEIKHVFLSRVLRLMKNKELEAALKDVDQAFQKMLQETPQLVRLPYYCSGCPHNTSTTHLPEGSRAVAGIGCHYMATWIDHNTATFTQMGGEGVPWIGQAPFTREKHIFANLGDGTYYHSGLLAIRAAIAAKVNITYKLLYNDAVAMTGGQHVDGPLDVAMITQQLYAEGIRRLVVLSDEPNKYPIGFGFAPGVQIGHRDMLDQVQEDLVKWPGVSVLVYDQTCAAEKRRRRKRGLMEDPDQRIFINEAVCEGCGDCSVKSNCLSVTPVETPWGRKRQIDQSSCNKDYSCVKGFCPSFVAVHGAKIRTQKPQGEDVSHLENLPTPRAHSLQNTYNIYVTGVGGTGIVTVGALIGMAAHLEEKGCSIVDMAGLAQKGGAVVSHIRLAKTPSQIHATRVSTGTAHLIFGADLVVAALPDTLKRVFSGHTRALINTDQTITGHFIGNPDYKFHHQALLKKVEGAVGKDHLDVIDATSLATKLLGDAIMANIFMLGYVYQKGWLPLSHASIEEAICLNNVAVEANLRAFKWGRYAAINKEHVREVAGGQDMPTREKFIPKTFEDIVQHRAKFLTAYQDQKYANRYLELARVVKAVDDKLGREELSLAVAKNYAKLLAIKDEYEVARLYTRPEFKRALMEQFEGPVRLNFFLAPPLFSKPDPQTGEVTKKRYGGWMMGAFGILARLKGLRGTAFDIFGYTQERKMERRLLALYEELVADILDQVDAHNYAYGVELANLPEHIRGFGHVKLRNLQAASENKEALMLKFRQKRAA